MRPPRSGRSLLLRGRKMTEAVEPVRGLIIILAGNRNRSFAGEPYERTHQQAARSARGKDKARAMVGPPGFIRLRLLRSLIDHAEMRFINVAEWASDSDLDRGYENPE